MFGPGATIVAHSTYSIDSFSLIIIATSKQVSRMRYAIYTNVDWCALRDSL